MPQVRNKYASNKKYKSVKKEIQMLQIRNTNVSNRKCEEERKSDI